MSSNGSPSNITYFWGPTCSNGQFSQWYPAEFQEDGVAFPTAEHYMMYKKALLFNDATTAKKIMAQSSARKVKELGRLIKNFDEIEWDKHKLNIVVNGNMLKFSQHPELKDQLLKTTGLLVEASPYDRIWGIGYSTKNADNNKDNWGQNLLGRSLMYVREKLRASASQPVDTHMEL